MEISQYWPVAEIGQQNSELATVSELHPPTKPGIGEATGAKVRRASEMPKPPPTKWLGKGFIPRASASVLIGPEGIGKSLLWVMVAAAVSTGQPMPAFNIPKREARDVIVIVTEDTLSEVFARLEIAGADMSKVHIVSELDDGSGAPIIPGDENVILELATNKAINPALVVVDGWLDVVPSGMNVQKTQMARLALAPWKMIATRLDAAVLLLTHTNRIDSGNVRDRYGVSAAIRQVARMTLLADRKDGDGENGDINHLWVGPEKSNTTGTTNAIKFDLEVVQHREHTDDDPGTVARLINPADAGASIRELTNSWRMERMQAEKSPSSGSRAEEWLKDFMADSDSKPSSEVLEAAKAEGLGEKAIRSAMSKLGRATPSGQGSAWIFTLNDIANTANMSKTANTANTANTGNETWQTWQTWQPNETWQPIANTDCQHCNQPLHKVQIQAGELTHPSCDKLAS